VPASVSTDQPTVWTFLDFEVGDEPADLLAQSLADSLLADCGWYADFTVGDDHVVVFAGRIFRYRRGSGTVFSASTSQDEVDRPSVHGDRLAAAGLLAVTQPRTPQERQNDAAPHRSYEP